MKHINVALFVPHAGCPHTCSFCNQKTISGSAKQLTKEDIDSAVAIASHSVYDRANSEIAFFGGSFTAIDRDYMVYLLEAAYPYIKSGLFGGIRCSTRPDAIDKETLDILKKYGVRAIELGAQSMDDTVLSVNERGHTSEDIVRASELIKSEGFELGLQMMTGLYGDSDDKTVETARRIIELKPETVRIYPTVVLEGTTLADHYRSGRYKPQTVDEAAELCAKLLLMFENENIKVIRLGLHSGGNVEDGYIAGAYHPAFREICESKIYLNKAKELTERNGIKGKADVYVAPGEVSKMTGQKRCNVALLEKLGVRIKVKEDVKLKKYQLYIVNEEENVFKIT